MIWEHAELAKQLNVDVGRNPLREVKIIILVPDENTPRYLYKAESQSSSRG